MKRLNSLALDFVGLAIDDINISRHDVYINGFETGFKEAFNFIQNHLTEHKNELSEYPMMGERKMAVIKMQEKLMDILKQMEEKYD